MKKLIFSSAVMLFIFVQASFGWSRTGHDAVAAIAERNLTPTAKATIEKYLGNRSIIYYASWMDYHRRYPEYKHTHYWHTAPVNEDYRYVDELYKAPGNAVYGIEYAMKNLKDYKNLSDSTVAVNLYYLIHLIGDFHCPVHVKYPGVKNYNVLRGGKEISYHKVWDGVVLDDNHRWSYTEWADQLDRFSPEQIEKIVAGTPRDWFRETAIDCEVIFEMAPAGHEINTPDRRFLNDAKILADNQIRKAGYRLAKVLNDLFN